ncbi:hypothetical protein BT69DRAFT_211649 [Atractiella rhizophila]|nr:hypothetical protein BT69DRAFT_211649 [Atractiella rhizophila]
MCVDFENCPINLSCIEVISTTFMIRKKGKENSYNLPSRSKWYWRFNFGRGGTSLLPFYAFTLCIACCTARSTEERQLGELSAEAEMELDNVRTMLLAKSRTGHAGQAENLASILPPCPPLFSPLRGKGGGEFGLTQTMSG